MQAIINTNVDQPKRYQCRHIFTDGHRCGSPCLRGEELCYYHHTTRKPVTGTRRRRCRRSAFDLPLPEDRSAIQSSIGQVLQRIASNDIDPRRAGLLLYGLQIASLNLPRDPSTRASAPAAETVEEIVLDPTLGPLAPVSEAGKNSTRRSPVADLLDQLCLSDQHTPSTAPQHQEVSDSAASAVLPQLQAAASLYPGEPKPAPSNRNKLSHRILARPRHCKRSQIFVSVTPHERKILQAIPGNLFELHRRPQRGMANLLCGVCCKSRCRVLQKRNQTFHPKVRPSMPRLHHSLGDQKQLRPRLKRLHRRLMRQVGKQTQRHRLARQQPRTLGVVKHRRQRTRIHISKDAKRKVIATKKRRRETKSSRSPDQRMVNHLHQLRCGVHHIRPFCPQQLRTLSAKRLLHLSGYRLRLFFGARDIGQQKDHMRTKIDRIEKITACPVRMILGMEVETI